MRCLSLFRVTLSAPYTFPNIFLLCCSCPRLVSLADRNWNSPREREVKATCVFHPFTSFLEPFSVILQIPYSSFLHLDQKFPDGPVTTPIDGNYVKTIPFHLRYPYSPANKPFYLEPLQWASPPHIVQKLQGLDTVYTTVPKVDERPSRHLLRADLFTGSRTTLLLPCPLLSSGPGTRTLTAGSKRNPHL